MEEAFDGIFCGHVDSPTVRAAPSSRLTRLPVPVTLTMCNTPRRQASSPKETYGSCKKPSEATNAHFQGKIGRGNLDQAGPGEAGCRGAGGRGPGQHAAHGMAFSHFSGSISRASQAVW